MTVGAVNLLLLLASVALASTTTDRDFDHRYPSCFLDRLEHCNDVQGLAAKLQCLDKKLGQLSPRCRTSLEKSPAFQCSFDALLLCPRANDHYDMMSCLWSHRDEHLSSRCAASGSHQSDWGLAFKFHECRKDKKMFCYGLHGFPRVMACLADHENDLSEECKAAVGECPAFKCAHDAQHFCPEVKSHHDFLKCIWAHRTEVSDECKQVMSAPPTSAWLSHEHDRHPDTHHQQERHGKQHGMHHGHHCTHHKGYGGHLKEHHGKYHDTHHEDHHEGQYQHHGGHLPGLERHRKKHHGHCKKRHHRRHHGHEHGMRACKFDIRRFCYDVKGFVDKMACLAKNEDSLSDSCYMTMKRCPAFYCASDVQKFCPGTKNRHEFVECLWEHRHELPDKCMNQDHKDDDHIRMKDKCRHERERFCPEEQKRSPKHDIECLGNQDRSGLSEECRESLDMRVGCQDEVKKFCGYRDSYPLRCLKEHEEELDDKCKAALPHHQMMSISGWAPKPAATTRPAMVACACIFLVFFIATLFATLTVMYRKRENRQQIDNQYQRI